MKLPTLQDCVTWTIMGVFLTLGHAVSGPLFSAITSLAAKAAS